MCTPNISLSNQINQKLSKNLKSIIRSYFNYYNTLIVMKHPSNIKVKTQTITQLHLEQQSYVNYSLR